MKSKLRWIGIMTVLVAGLSLLWCSRNQVIRTGRGTVVLSKRFMTLKDTFVDARTWRYADFEASPEIRLALESNGYGDYLKTLRNEDFKQSVSNAVESAKHALREVAGEIRQAVKGAPAEPVTPPTGPAP